MAELTPEEKERAFVEYAEYVGRMAEHSAVIAFARRSLYLAYVSEGFTPEQAIELAKSIAIA